MAKRTNPFVDDFIPQSKKYVGLKQLNNSNEDGLRKIYAKTLQLLFNGAKKSVANALPISQETKSNDSKMKQLFIANDGSLLQKGNLIHKPRLKQCNCNEIMENQCAYCEAPLCRTCCVNCIKCKHIYCNRCVLPGGDGVVICVSCYS